MKIGALQSKNQKFNDFVELVGAITDTDLYTDQEFMMAHLNSYDSILIDTSQEVHIVNKLITILLDQSPQIHLIAVDSKGRNLDKLAKTYSEHHFKLALQISMEKNEIISELENHFDEQISQTTRSVVLRVIQDHLEGNISERAQKASDGLDLLFAEEFSEEYRGEDSTAENNDETNETHTEFKFEIDEGDNVSDSNNDDLSIELSTDDLDLDLGDDSPEELNQDDSTGLELSLDDDIELNVEGNNAEAEDTLMGVEIDDSDLEDFDEPTMITQTPDPSISELDFNVSEEVNHDEPSFSADVGDDMGDDLSFNLDEESDEIQISDETSVSQMFDLGDEDAGATEAFKVEEDFNLDDLSEPEDLSGGLSFDEGQADDFSDSDNPLEELKTKILELDSILAADNESSQDSIDQDDTIEFNDNLDDGDETITEGFSLDAMEEDEEFDEPTAVTESGFETQVSLKTPVLSSDNLPSGAEFNAYKQHHEDELLRMSETIKALRVDRDRLAKIVSEQEKQLQGQNDGRGYLQAEIDEKKIEIEIIKKRNLKQVEDLGIKLELVQNKNDILNEQNKVYQREIEKLQKETSIDQKHKRSKERELQEKLELLKKDTEVQIRNRDNKILDLKRQIDSLEFDIESASNRERKSQVQQQVVEDKMNKVIRTLRTVIGQVEEDNVLEERKKIIKKNLDV